MTRKDQTMTGSITQQVLALKRLNVPALRAKHLCLFGEETHTHNKSWLLKRLAWRLQALAEGDLSDRARQRAAELACEADLRLTPPRLAKKRTASVVAATRTLKTDRRLPAPGTILTRRYKGELLQVEVLPEGFLYQGSRYPSLSAVAKAITQSHCNGFLFFRLTAAGGSR